MCSGACVTPFPSSPAARCIAAYSGHGISRLPRDNAADSKRKAFKETKIGYIHIDSAQFRSAEGKTHMFLAIDRVSKFVYVEFHPTAEMATGGAFMRNVIKALPYQIHTVLTDNDVAFTKNASTKWDGMRHVFDRACDEHGIGHRLTKPYHPWTNGQAERMNRTVKDATIKVLHYETTQALCAHVLAFVAAYNFAKHLKALRWRTPFQTICEAWKADPTSFKVNPHHIIPGPNTTSLRESGSSLPAQRSDVPPRPRLRFIIAG